MTEETTPSGIPDLEVEARRVVLDFINLGHPYAHYNDLYALIVGALRSVGTAVERAERQWVINHASNVGQEFALMAEKRHCDGRLDDEFLWDVRTNLAQSFESEFSSRDERYADSSAWPELREKVLA